LEFSKINFSLIAIDAECLAYNAGMVKRENQTRRETAAIACGIAACIQSLSQQMHASPAGAPEKRGLR
jgi:hypothetical protein